MNETQMKARIAELETQLAAVQHGVPEGWRMVPVEFVRGFCDLAHNYSLQAEAPDFYHGVERDAFSAAYKRCGHDLANLRVMLSAAHRTQQGMDAMEQDAEKPEKGNRYCGCRMCLETDAEHEPSCNRHAAQAKQGRV